MNEITILGLIFTSVCLIGFYGAYLYGRNVKRFRWSEYIAIIICPLISIAILIFTVDLMIFNLFIISMILGTSFEYLFGLVYEKTLNRKLWKYEKFSIHGYTSLLSIPVWGIAGVVFWFIGKSIGL